MKTATKRILMTTAAVAVVAGLGMAAVSSGAEARGWGDGPGFYQGMGGGPCGRGGMMAGPGGPGGPGGRVGGSGGMLTVMDADDDGTVTRAEFDRFHDLGFAAMDTDGDGEVSRQDFIDGRQPVFVTDDDRGRRWNSDQRAERRANRLGQRFDVWDANADGVVTADEFKAAGATRFEVLDLDGNGAVEKQEVAAAMMFGPRGSMMGRQ
ncbi:EF hand [Rhodospira trueperi]|uniref:EF hand n=2 Tax=Rhodospira trueperi TaxID=69960 RepID=A0A1G6WGD1_9PROT|nr:EF hand [Rhodospira trueperi]